MNSVSCLLPVQPVRRRSLVSPCHWERRSLPLAVSSTPTPQSVASALPPASLAPPLPPAGWSSKRPPLRCTWGQVRQSARTVLSLTGRRFDSSPFCLFSTVAIGYDCLHRGSWDPAGRCRGNNPELIQEDGCSVSGSPIRPSTNRIAPFRRCSASWLDGNMGRHKTTVTTCLFMIINTFSFK